MLPCIYDLHCNNHVVCGERIDCNLFIIWYGRPTLRGGYPVRPLSRLSKPTSTTASQRGSKTYLGDVRGVQAGWLRSNGEGEVETDATGKSMGLASERKCLDIWLRERGNV